MLVARVMPSEYARGAIEAAAALIVDPNHAAWVQQHWGAAYLYNENVFYRTLYISGLTSYRPREYGNSLTCSPPSKG
jgi:hypothetical protein